MKYRKHAHGYNSFLFSSIFSATNDSQEIEIDNNTNTKHESKKLKIMARKQR